MGRQVCRIYIHPVTCTPVPKNPVSLEICANSLSISIGLDYAHNPFSYCLYLESQSARITTFIVSCRMGYAADFSHD